MRKMALNQTILKHDGIANATLSFIRAHHPTTKSKIHVNFLVAILIAALVVVALPSAFSVRQEQVHAQTSGPVAGASVYLCSLDDLQDYLPYGYPPDSVTDSQGNYNVTHLDTDNYSISVIAPGYINSEIDNIPVTNGTVTSNVTITLPVSGVITGQVTDQTTGAPLPGLNVSVYLGYSDFLAGPMSSTLTASDGTYWLNTNLDNGSYLLTVSASGYVSFEDLVVVTAGFIKNVNVALAHSAIISGTVRDSVTLAPLANVAVKASGGSGSIEVDAASSGSVNINPLMIMDNGLGTSAVTNSSGQYTINTNLATGTYNITVPQFSGYMPKEIDNIITTEGSQTNLNLNLDPSGIISGRLTSSLSGQPLAGAWVYDNVTGRMVYTNSSGYYQIKTGIGTGTYTITAVISGGWYSIRSGVNVVQGQETSNINFQFAVPTYGLAITGKVTDSSGNPISSASVTAHGTGSIIGVSTDSTGDYVISSWSLYTGTYNVTVTAGGFTSQVQTGVTVVLNEVTSNVNFQLSPDPTLSNLAGAISGTVLFQEMAPQPSPSPTATPTPTLTETPAPTSSPSPSASPTSSPTATPTGTPTPTPTEVPTSTPTPTASPTIPPTTVVTPSSTPTATQTPVPTTAATETPSQTATATPSTSPAQTPSSSVPPSSSPQQTAAPRQTSTSPMSLPIPVFAAIVIIALVLAGLFMNLRKRTRNERLKPNDLRHRNTHFYFPTLLLIIFFSVCFNRFMLIVF